MSDLGGVISDMNTDDTTTEDTIAELGSMISDIYAQLEELKRMVKFYLMRIKRGIMTIDEVPSLWREKVKTLLNEAEKNK